MTRFVTIYRLRDGVILRTVRVSARDSAEQQLAAGEAAIEGAHDWQSTRIVDGQPVAYVPAPPVVTAADVKAEAARRIDAAWPAWRQLNTLREGTAEQVAAMGAAIDAIRAASDRIEALAPIPQHYRDDELWQA